jgi:uncharacterized protein YidB (DUF937 family)
MSLFDKFGGSLSEMIGQVTAATAPSLLTAVLAKTNLGDLQGLVNQLQQNGLGTQVTSWLGSGGNMPISPEQIKAALGNEQVKQIAAHFGVPVDSALKMLAEHLPATVDQASPDGTLRT